MNNEEIESIIKEIDALIEEVERGGEEPSEEFFELLDQIASDIKEARQDEDKKKAEKSSQELIDKLNQLITISSKSENISLGTSQSIIDAINKIKIDVPSPQVNVAPPNVDVTVPKIEIPPINVPPTTVTIPDEVKVKKPSWLSEIVSLTPIIKKIDEIKSAILAFKLPKDPLHPIPVRLSDGEKFYRAMGGLVSSIGGMLFPFVNSLKKETQALVDDDGHQQIDIQSSELPSGAATSAKQLPDNHQVTVSNIASTPVITGFATSANQTTGNTSVGNIDLNTEFMKFQANDVDDYTTTNVTYVGLETKAGTWMIKKLDETGNFLTINYASVTNNALLTDYTTAWAARTTATYADFSSAF